MTLIISNPHNKFFKFSRGANIWEPSTFTTYQPLKGSKQSSKFGVNYGIKEAERDDAAQTSRILSGLEVNGQLKEEENSDWDWPPWDNLPQRYKLISTMSLSFVICNMDKVEIGEGISSSAATDRNNRHLRTPGICGLGSVFSEKWGSVLEKPLIEKTTPGRESEFDLRKWRAPYRVLLHNDNYNKREYVVQVLMKVIPGMTLVNAVNVMQEAHINGMSVVIICAQADAEEHCTQLRGNGLFSSIEPADFAGS